MYQTNSFNSKLNFTGHILNSNKNKLKFSKKLNEPFLFVKSAIESPMTMIKSLSQSSRDQSDQKFFPRFYELENNLFNKKIKIKKVKEYNYFNDLMSKIENKNN